MLSAAASLGMILLWDVDGGLTQIDKYLYSSEDYIKVNFSIRLSEEPLSMIMSILSVFLTPTSSCLSLCSLVPFWLVALSTQV